MIVVVKNMKIAYNDSKIHIQTTKACMPDELLQEFFLARSTRYRYLSEQRITIDHSPIHPQQEIKGNSELIISLIAEDDNIVPSNIPCVVVYEDDVFLIVDKPSGIIIHEDGTYQMETLDQRVKRYYQLHGIHAPVRAIHRLDKDTSGLVIYCKIPFFQPLLDHMLEEKKLERIYLAIVKGNLDKKQIKIEKAIGKDRHNAKKMRISPQGKYASTMVFRRKNLTDATLVECHLKTGRTHQIRVHMASISHPLLSDAMYGTQDERIARCALHAWKVKLYHPLLDKNMEIVCEMPSEMLNIIKN